MTNAPDVLNDSLSKIKGRSLASVEFVKDYVQFRFEGPCLTAYTWPTVLSASRTFSRGDLCYRDALCDRIGVEVEDIAVEEGRDISIQFRDGTTFTISLKDDDYRGPEAVYFVGEDGSWWVL